MSRLAVAALLLLASIGGLLGAAVWNRRGDTQTIVLTERELSLTRSAPGGRGEGRLALRFDWQARSGPQESRLWLTDLKLQELGFDVGLPAGAPGAAIFYGRSLPRLAWVAFEYDGPAWRAIEQRLETFDPPPYAEAIERSRLVPIDAAVDDERLRRRHAGQPVVVLRAIIALRYESDPRTGPSVWGVIERLVSPEVSVPAHLSARLERLPERNPRSRDSGPSPAPPAPPRYEVTLGVGRLGGVWVQDLRPIQ